MSADQLEAHAKKLIKNQLKGLTEDEKADLVSKKLKEVVKKQVHEKQDKQVAAWEDKIQFTKEGWKERYYREKFLVSGQSELKEFCKNIRQAYIEGLEWVLQYYYNGCQSWYWYYPYHYAPFASDLLGCDKLTINFEMGEPAKPFE
jgi:5'-3' exoribonuclease 2